MNPQLTAAQERAREEFELDIRLLFQEWKVREMAAANPQQDFRSAEAHEKAVNHRYKVMAFKQKVRIASTWNEASEATINDMLQYTHLGEAFLEGVGSYREWLQALSKLKNHD